ncbi:hypothetical protein ELE36_07490 [Pseudolysobacter antarcticus]|uniref:O-GlcNAc transferase C-terminal domain-containing protein n=1 Tax=Pseudolysobacter antarcticus TaxID=2511995 RepID=A0A411HI78_9GAMM|nr:hypothetical protein [Pseudolysobacter antarcticus]QBB70216.1 hypothetical protein ELE36_07490 [Pseudolysobacter antarcticus]
MSTSKPQDTLDSAQAAFVSGDFAHAFDLLGKLLSVSPQLHQARALRVNAALQLEHWRDASVDLELLSQVMPQHAQFRRLLGLCWLRIGNTHRDAKQTDTSISAYRTSMAVDPHAQDARYNIALLLKESNSGRAEAMSLLFQVIAAEPNNREAQLHQSELLIDFRRESEALALLLELAKNVAVDVFVAERCCSLLLRIGAIDPACELAIRHFDQHPQRWREAGRIAIELRENDALDAANIVLDRILRDTTDASTRFTLTLARRLGMASTYVSDNEINLARKIFSDGLDALITDYPQQILGEISLDPGLLLWSNFFLAYLGRDDRELQQRFGNWLSAAMNHCLPTIAPRKRHGHLRPRLVLVSSFFRVCTVGSYFHSWVEYLAQGDWELVVVQLGPHFDSETDKLERHASRLLRLELPQRELAQTIADLQADIVLYPELGMDARTFSLAALRLAPIQVCAWGHPVTSGLPSIDVFLSCAEMEPAHAQQHYSERLQLLPGLGTRYLSPKLPTVATREELDLPEARHLYLVPQSPFKLHPHNDAVLVEVLRRDPSALFVMFDGPRRGPTQNMQRRVLQALNAVSSEPKNHLRILAHGSRDYFLRVNKVCDVMLDSLYWSGGNTTLDALHCGLPVVTCPGEFMRGRQSMAMLRRLGCDELIVGSPLALAESAVALAQDRTRRASISARIRERLPMLTDDVAPLLALDKILRDLLPSNHENFA